MSFSIINDQYKSDGEPTIIRGTTSQYWRGDKTFQELNKSTVGLSNVDNTSDLNKPVSNAVQSSLDLKANLESPSFTGTVSGITKSTVGLSNVDNTSDLNKPVSNAVQSSLDLKANLESPSFTGTVSASNFSGLASSASSIVLSNDNTSGDYYIPFTKNSTGTSLLYTDSSDTPLTYNPNTGLLNVSKLSISQELPGLYLLYQGLNSTTSLEYAPDNVTTIQTFFKGPYRSAVITKGMYEWEMFINIYDMTTATGRIFFVNFEIANGFVTRGGWYLFNDTAPNTTSTVAAINNWQFALNTPTISRYSTEIVVSPTVTSQNNIMYARGFFYFEPNIGQTTGSFTPKFKSTNTPPGLNARLCFSNYLKIQKLGSSLGGGIIGEWTL
jgi:hypothetical protein